MVLATINTWDRWTALTHLIYTSELTECFMMCGELAGGTWAICGELASGTWATCLSDIEDLPTGTNIGTSMSLRQWACVCWDMS